MRRLILAALAGVTLAAAPARAADQLTVERLVVSFSKICMEHIGDPAAQAAAVQAAPYNFKPTRRGVKGEQTYERDGVEFGIGGPDNVCAITGEMVSSATQAQAVDKIRATFLLGEGETTDSGDTTMWKIETNDSKQRFAIGVMISARPERTLGTLLVQTLK